MPDFDGYTVQLSGGPASGKKYVIPGWLSGRLEFPVIDELPWSGNDDPLETPRIKRALYIDTGLLGEGGTIVYEFIGYSDA